MKALRIVLSVLIAGVVVGAAIVLPLLVADQDEPPVALVGPPNGQRTTVANLDAEDLSAVRHYGDLPRNHVVDHVDYPQTPPVGGQHDARWLNCGVYAEPVREENAVHALEHGTVWITYDPALGAEDVSRLADILPDEGILSPYEGLPSPVVVTVWATQLELVGAADPRLSTFLREYGNKETAPEPRASCAAGVERLESEDRSAI